MNNNNLFVANEILRQLGGAGRVSTMIGVKAFVGTENSLSFRFKARALQAINTVRVTLDPSDTYTVQFLRSNKNGVKLVSERSDVYCDDLIELVEKTTGLYLHL